MTTGSRPRLAVFDCDGTLVDSQRFIVLCMEAAFRAESLTAPSAESVRRVIGLPLETCMAKLAPEQPSARHERLAEAYKDSFHVIRQRADHYEPLFDGALDALDALEAAGFLLGVATGKGRRGLDAVLGRHGISRRFVTLQTSDIAPGKPHPAMLERAMAEAGVSPADTVMIGDTTFDMEMARNASTFAVGVRWGYHPPEDLVAAGAHSLCTHFTELAAGLAALQWRDACA